MDPRARRDAIRDHLNIAREALDCGDTAAARTAIQAALALDPEYLAARALLERVDAPRNRQPAESTAPLTSSPPYVSTDGWARFEQRARSRRIERRAAAARQAIAEGRLEQAREILAEIRGIDPGHPELISLSIELDAAEHQPRTRRHIIGPLVAGLCASGVLVVWAGGRLERAPASAPANVMVQTAPTGTRADVPAPPPQAIAEPAATAELAVPLAERSDAAAAPTSTTGTSGATPVSEVPSARPPQAAPAAEETDDSDVEPVRPLPPIVWPPPDLTSSATLPSPAVSAAVLPPSPVPTLSASEPIDASPSLEVSRRVVAANDRVTPFPVAAERRDDELVREALQQYRLAYDQLDVRSAQAVWPSVDSAALQRAFDGLQSQRLTFDDCQVEVRGTSGEVVCRGSARYIPKIGSREPRVEPRVWRFGMRKSGDTWQIATARAER